MVGRLCLRPLTTTMTAHKKRCCRRVVVAGSSSSSSSGFVVTQPHSSLVRLFSSGVGGSDSITYSGGQAHRGQGGYYGSGGARALRQPSAADDASTATTTAGGGTSTRSKMLALAKDVETVEQVMEQVEALEQELESLLTDDPTLTTKAMELKNAIKKTLTNTVFEQALDNLEIQGSPVWGLSTAEREMIMMARGKRNEC